MKWSISVKTTLACVVTLAMLAFVGLTSFLQARESKSLAFWVSHSHEVLNILADCRALADASEDEARSYAETGDSKFLSEYRSHSTELAAQCSELVKQVKDNPDQTQRANSLAQTSQDQIKICDEITALGPAANEKLAVSLRLVRHLDDVVAESEAEEKHLLAMRSQKFLDASRNILLSQGILLAASLLLLTASYYLVRRYVDDQQRSQGVLKSSKLQFTGIFNQAFQQVWVLSKEGNLLQTNETALDFVGLTRETEVGRPFWETAWWPHQGSEQERFKTALAAAAQGSIQRFEMESTQADGQAVVLDFSLKPLLGEKGEVMFIIAEGRDITEFKVAQSELKENEIRLQAIMQSLAEGMYQLDIDGTLLYVNPNGARMLGYTNEEIIGKSMHDLVHPNASSANDCCSVFKVINSGGSQNCEDRFRRKDGTFIPVQLMSAPLIVDGEITGAVVSFYDITDRKEAQARSNMQYALTNIFSQAESLTSAAPQLLRQICKDSAWSAGVVWLVKEEPDATTLELVNTWSRTPLAFGPDSHFSSKRSLTLGEDFAGKVWAENAPLWIGKGSHSESPMLAEAVGLGLNNVFALPVRSDEKVVGVISLFSPAAEEPTSSQLQMLNAISSQCGLFIERKRSEEQLRDSEMLFQQLVNNIREIFWVSSAKPGHNKVLYVSPAFEEVWGRPVSEVYERASSYLDAVVPEDKARVKQHVLKEMYSGSAIEYRIMRPDGTIRWVWGRWSVVNGEDGKPERLVGIVHDISERKEMERRVSEFYSTVSHELRTPLTSIRASLGLLEGGIAGELPAKAKKLVDIARSESDRLIRLINDILDIRKIEAGRLELKLRPVKVRKIVELTLQGTAGMAHEYGVKLVPDIETEVESLCDQDRLIQVLTNLVSNAIKYAPKASDVTVKVNDRGNFCRFSVTDTGPGIPEEHLSKLFGLFQQLDSTDSRQKGGTGLGLAISKAIIEQHGGTIAVKTKPGEGATFYFDVPMNKPDQTEDEPSVDTDFRAGYILLVEDDMKLTVVLKQLLEGENYRVQVARTVAEADEKICHWRPQAVILDVHLPDGNGLDWMRKISAEGAPGQNVPVVVLTGQEADDSYGVPLLIDWLRKPVDIPQLLQALKVGLVQSQTTASPRVLIVEDDESTREILAHQLSDLGIKSMEASSGFMALQMVQEHKPDLIILDLGLPGFDGFDLVKKLEVGCSKATPLLVYTSRDLTNADMEKLKLGLTRHLIKSKTSQAEFLAAVTELLNNVLPPRDTVSPGVTKA